MVTAADDPEQAYIRRCGAEIALTCDQLPIPPTVPLAPHPRTLTAEQIEAIHAYTDPASASYQLARLITRLPDEMLALLGGDQITDKAILGCLVPEPARPILRAIDDKHEPVLDLLVWATPEPVEDTTSAEDQFAAALGWLLRGRDAQIRSDEVSPQLRSRLEALRADRILDLNGGVYRASHIALYSSFTRAEPPSRTADIRVSRSTVIA